TGVNVVSDTVLRVVTPPGPQAKVSVKVTTAGGSVTFGTQHRYLAPLYAADGRAVNGNLYSVDPATSAFVAIGAIGHAVTGLAISPQGVLYGAATDPGAAKLITIDPYTAASTVVGAFQT